MTNARMEALGRQPSAIRELFAYGLQRKAVLGVDKVFDFSLGNPSIPTPDVVRRTIADLLTEHPCELHGYSPAAGNICVRRAVAEHIKRSFGVEASPESVYMTAGAAAGLAISIAALTEPNDEVIVIAPYFPEYRVWIEAASCTCVEVLARPDNFQIDVNALAAAITKKTAAIIINSPNNPTGAVYTRDTLEALTKVLAVKEEELGRALYIIADEPYREITYGAEVAYIPTMWPRTLVCYSYSKSLSLPGERIGYIYVSDLMNETREVTYAVAGAGRALGFVCAPVLFQRVIKCCVDVPSDVKAYAENREALTQGLSQIGYEYSTPDGAFYLWMRSLETDAVAFSQRARAHELLLVPSDSFGVGGWVRVSYCVAHKMIDAALPAFQALWDEYHQA